MIVCIGVGFNVIVQKMEGETKNKIRFVFRIGIIYYLNVRKVLINFKMLLLVKELALSWLYSCGGCPALWCDECHPGFEAIQRSLNGNS